MKKSGRLRKFLRRRGAGARLYNRQKESHPPESRWTVANTHPAAAGDPGAGSAWFPEFDLACLWWQKCVK